MDIHQDVKREDKVAKFKGRSEALEAEVKLLKEENFAEAAKCRIAYLTEQVSDLEERIGNRKKVDMAKAKACQG